jgi:hypothetical protein
MKAYKIIDKVQCKEQQDNVIMIRVPEFIRSFIKNTKGFKTKSINSLCEMALELLGVDTLHIHKVNNNILNYSFCNKRNDVNMSNKKMMKIVLNKDISERIRNEIPYENFSSKIITLCYIAINHLENRNQTIVSY